MGETSGQGLGAGSAPEQVAGMAGAAEEVTGVPDAGLAVEAISPPDSDERADESRRRSKTMAVGAGAVALGAAAAAVAARDTRRRVLGIPVGVRSRRRRVADTVREPARRLGSRFSRG